MNVWSNKLQNFTPRDITKSGLIFSHDNKSGKELLLDLARLLHDIRMPMVLPW